MRLRSLGSSSEAFWCVAAEDVARIIDTLRTTECTLRLRGREGAAMLNSALSLPGQTFGGQDLYPTLAAKAARLLYSLVKNHPFDQGNKRFAWMATEVFVENCGYGLAVDGDAILAWVTWIASADGPEIAHIERWLSGALYPLV